MFARLNRWWSQFYRNARTVNNEPLNKVSLIVILVVDLFILTNVFMGLNDISQWHLNPADAYPCYGAWANYREVNSDKPADRDFAFIQRSIASGNLSQDSVQQRYQRLQVDHLGTVSKTCLKSAEYQDQANTAENRKTLQTIDQRQAKIRSLEQANTKIRSQYDSTLLEKLAGQPKNQSINEVSAEKAKQELDKNNQAIATLKQEIADLKQQLLAKPEVVNFLGFLGDEGQFKTVEQGYDQAAFWYPSIQFLFQALFLIPLIGLALWVHRLANRRGYGLIALISWHLLVIFCIPLLLKLFEFLQVGVVFEFVFDVISALFGGLLFLVSYVYILLIPLLGFGIIKFFQRFVFNQKLQAANRVQKSRCIGCGRKIRHQDSHCPHCGFYQFVECPNCHQPTYQYLPYCKECGHPQEFDRLSEVPPSSPDHLPPLDHLPD
ncbi:hypothetical protein [Alkalinema sp. FACHB-956]|uniref:hypothetical protein n=1 Tax=Alkalinema sp. FACHB-956 TaxID=2692768 RepID=UPI00168430CE|nr:hypothetical protein [Alkalinema sp. FACHB-956]MBD2325289.1 hypothetical protein [Alkalinema sp. FACHB-956]